MVRPAATPPRTALVAGATGLIGQALLAQLLDNDRYGRVEVVARRPLTSPLARHPRLAVRIGDGAALAGAEPRADDVYIALGTTIKVAGSEAAFRAVDFDLVVAIARAARQAGASRLGVVSALGADATSLVFYNRVKGEMEAAVRSLGYSSVVIARPSLLLGDRAALGQPTRRGEVWAARLFQPGAAARSGIRRATGRGRVADAPALRVLSSAGWSCAAARAQPSPAST